MIWLATLVLLAALAVVQVVRSQHASDSKAKHDVACIRARYNPPPASVPDDCPP